MARHFVTDLDVSREEQQEILDLAVDVKSNPDRYRNALDRKILGMVFDKNSTRTRVSFESGMVQLGGHAIFLPSNMSQASRGEIPSDTGRVLSRYVDLIMIRTFEHQVIVEMAGASSVPVINGLDDDYHPCQILADLLTIREAFGEIAGRQLVYVGDGNNMAHSLMLGGALAGLNVRIVSPSDYWPEKEYVLTAKNIGKISGSTIEVTSDLDAVGGADIVYADVWASMGQEEEARKRLEIFEDFQVDEEMMKKAKPDAIFLHCLPAHRGEEVSAGVIDGYQSRVFDQAENRLHAQKALMLFLHEASK